MEFLVIASAHFLALLSPGPDFFLIMQAALRLPRRYGIAICAGIALANGLYLLLAIGGLEVVRQLDWLLLPLRYLGAAYLLFLGVMLLRSPKQEVADRRSSPPLHGARLGRQFLIGFLSAALNPKNAVFYLSLFTVMVSPDTSLLRRCLYGLWMSSMVFCWDCLVLLVISRVRQTRWLGDSIYLVEKLAGAALASFGLILPFS